MCLLMFSLMNWQVWNATLVVWQRSCSRQQTRSNFTLRGNARRNAGVLFLSGVCIRFFHEGADTEKIISMKLRKVLGCWYTRRVVKFGYTTKGSEKVATLITHAEAKEQLAEEWSWLADAKHIEDEVRALANSALPIYTADTIKVWTELPNDYSNKFSEIRSAGEWLDFTIEDLMNDDLYLYYDFVFMGALAELAEERGLNLDN